jgi:CBS domain-containing protein
MKTLTPELTTTRVADVMHPGVFTISPDAPLRDVALIMASERAHSVVVCDSQENGTPGALWGVVSDLDLVGTASADGVDDRTARAAAVTPALTVGPDETLERAAQIMTEHGVAHFVVVDRASGRPVGVLSTLDLAAVLAAH